MSAGKQAKFQTDDQYGFGELLSAFGFRNKFWRPSEKNSLGQLCCIIGDDMNKTFPRILGIRNKSHWRRITPLKIALYEGHGAVFDVLKSAMDRKVTCEMTNNNFNRLVDSKGAHHENSFTFS